MQKFTTLEAIAVPMLRDNIDTDTIIPIPFLKEPDSDLGKHLFNNLRYNEDGSENTEFILNRPEYRTAKIVVSQENFGCGSSREHAVWALLAFGIRCVIAGSYGDIFYNNSLRMGLLPVVLPRAQLRALSDATVQGAGLRSTRVDLEMQTITDPGGGLHRFEIDPTRRRMLLEGLDAIGMTLLHADAIASFERDARRRRPWAYELRS
ncbi:MAG: 3-isopropylmalate dehydratase small subunit [Vulcanimicrobiaceae bacterium]